ncbi:hypothetical protein ZWY2020_000149 [Hordeum vulgare]|nr:hypothetical protein ZWY2020_000149 [Hordeum vulgare]
MSAAGDLSHTREEGRASIRARALPRGPPAGRLIDDILVEIISRMPAKALCRCKCVSKNSLGLIHHPDHRKRLPQTLADFFYSSSASTTGQRRLELPFRYTSLLEDRHRALFGASFTFLPKHHLPVDLLDSCNDLLLCRCYHVSHGGGAFRYVVCNPATHEWAVLPNSGKDSSEVATTSLGFDPAASPHFHVFQLVVEYNYSLDTELCGVAVYSSETGEWIYKEKTWNRATRDSSATVFLDGLLFFRTLDLEYHDCVAAVDTKGETCLIFRVPGGRVHDFGQADGFVQQVLFRVPGGRFDDFGLAHGFIQRSQGSLHFANFQRDQDGVAIRLVVQVLKDYQGEQWKLKHSIKTSDICGWTDLWLDADFDFVAIHPECNLLFFIVGAVALMCCNMDNRQVKVISYLGGAKPLFLPYVPLYTELPSLHI